MSGKTGKSSANVKAILAAAKKGEHVTTKSKRAGLVFPVARLRRYLKRTDKRLTATAPVLEYLVAELLELAGNACHDHKKRYIKPRHIQLAVRNDGEIDKLLNHVHIMEGGVIPFIQPQLMPQNSKHHVTK
ncbi:hypothetical protein F5890DRAFT_1504166 [Lentinula detonsa]|uniref:Histone H2A n=1 Tax=Lentinula detonsa TaxID=2804962 RepID=A0AA38Q318_9AGAR|nr:hypothetical protein F5890DRAFT_1504166 [Lentinula detonsa]